MTGATIRGRCLCGGFAFTVAGPLPPVRLCHCDTCRRSTGSAYSANCRVPAETFVITRKDTPLGSFESSPGARRHFCKACGSPVFALVETDPGHVRIRLGTLEREADAPVTAHVWVASKAAWDHIEDDLPQYPGPCAP